MATRSLKNLTFVSLDEERQMHTERFRVSLQWKVQLLDVCSLALFWKESLSEPADTVRVSAGCTDPMKAQEEAWRVTLLQAFVKEKGEKTPRALFQDE